MTSRNEKDRTKQIQEKCQTILNQLLKDEDNKYCVDCDAKGPRWASWNLGIFLCIRCAGIHRNLGVHISKVKSVNLDSWTPEQVVTLQQMGNSRARAVYEANLPDSFRRPQTDSALEAFVRAKYEHRKYVAREWVPPSPPQVNWDKEIDEEIERQKKKKKSVTSTTTLGSSSLSPADKKASKSSEVVPQLLPKPKSSASPKPGRTTPKRESGGTADLLGTSTAAAVAIETKTQAPAADDVFSSFLSAPQPPTDPNKNKTQESKAVDLKTEEESFFNQPAPSDKEKSKMTKDSILALYGQAPAQTLTNTQFPTTIQNGGFNATFPQNQMFNQSQFQQQPNSFAQNFTSFPSQGAFAQNGASQQNIGMQQNSFANNFNQFGAPPAQNSFAQFPAQQNQFAPQNSFANAFGNGPNQFSQAGGQFQAQNMNGGFSNAPVNGQQSMFNAQPNNLQQQFGSMSLGHQGAPNTMNAFPASQTMQAMFPNSSQSNMAANSVWQ